MIIRNISIDDWSKKKKAEIYKLNHRNPMRASHENGFWYFFFSIFGFAALLWQEKLTISIWDDVLLVSLYHVKFLFLVLVLFLFRFYFMDWFFRLAVFCLTIFTEFRLLQLLRTLFMMYGSVLSLPINPNTLAVFHLLWKRRWDSTGCDDEQRVQETKLSQSKL